MIQTDRNTLLQRLLDFTPQDLAINRTGALTDAQQAQLKSLQGCQQTSILISIVMFIVIIGGIAGYFAFLMPDREQFTQMFDRNPEMGVIVVAVLGVVLLVMVGSYLRTVGRARRLSRGEISTVTGNVKLKEINSRYGTSGQIRVGREKFIVTADILDAFVDDGMYVIYYVKNPPLHHILSAEALEI